MSNFRIGSHKKKQLHDQGSRRLGFHWWESLHELFWDLVRVIGDNFASTTTSEVGEFQIMHSSKFKEENGLSRAKFKGP